MSLIQINRYAIQKKLIAYTEIRIECTKSRDNKEV